MEEYNTIILGSGISGMSCAIYLKRAGLSTLIVENDTPGGQLNRIGTIENYPGYPSITGPDLAINLMNQVENYHIDYEYNNISSIDYTKNQIVIANKTYQFQHLVFATGRREKTLELPHEQEFIGHGISFCATCDGPLYKGENVIVVGGGSSAVSEAIYLSQICKQVYLIYRKENLKAEKILQDRLNKINNIKIIYNTTIQSYQIQDNKITGVKLENGKTLKARCIFLAIGHIPNSELFDGQKQNGYIIVDENYQTNKPNIYACGDVIQKELYQLITASSEGAIVANNIIKNQKK